MSYKMTIADIAHLTQIRTYLVNAINNFNVPKTNIKQLNETLILLDKKLVEYLLDDQFKSLIEFDNLETVMREATINNNIKSGLKNTKQHSVPSVSVVDGKAISVKPERI